MAFLLINNFDIPVAVDSASIETIHIGENRYGPSTRKSSNKRGMKYVINGDIPCVTSEEACALVGLINGDGYVWDFSGGYSALSTGLHPDTIDAPILNTVTGAISFLNAAVHLMTIDASINEDWTLIMRTVEGGTPFHRARTSTGLGYSNGVTSNNVLVPGTSGTGSFAVEVASQNVKIMRRVTGASADSITEMVILRFVATPQMIASFNASATSFQQGMPLLSCSGDFLMDRPTNVFIGEASSQDYIQESDRDDMLSGGGRWRTSNKAISFSLTEYKPRYEDL